MKVKQLENKLGKLNQYKIEAYGDSLGDRELLNSSSIPHFRSFSEEPIPYPHFSLTTILPFLSIVIFAYTILSTNLLNTVSIKNQNDLLIYILTGELLILFGYLIRFLRWRFLLNQTGLQPPLILDGIVWMGSFAFTATPGKAGEALRCLVLKEKLGIPTFKTLISLLLERITDGTAVLFLLIVNIPLMLKWKISLSIEEKDIVILGIIIFIIAFILLKIKETSISQLTKIKLFKNNKIINPKSQKILKKLLKPKIFCFATFLAVIAWTLEGISLMILLKGFDISLSLGGATIAHTTAGLIGALTFIPGGLGATEAGTISLLSIQGVPTEIAAPVTIIIRMMTLWFASILGIFCLSLPLNKFIGKNHYFKNKTST